MIVLAIAAVLLNATGCSPGPSGPAGPATLTEGQERCGSCRMTVSDVRAAAQLVVPGRKPIFFDDIACLRTWLVRAPAVPPGAVAFVADHRTGSWVRAKRAVYAQVPGLRTPMMSHMVAHEDAASRDADPGAKGGTPLAAAEVFAPARVPDGAPPGQ
jgi:copper chaperone NosL